MLHEKRKKKKVKLNATFNINLYVDNTQDKIC